MMFDKVDEWLSTHSAKTHKQYKSAIKYLIEYLKDKEFEYSDYKRYSEEITIYMSEDTIRKRITAANSYFSYIGRRPFFYTNYKDIIHLEPSVLTGTLDRLTGGKGTKIRDAFAICIMSELPVSVPKLREITQSYVFSKKISPKLKEIMYNYRNNVFGNGSGLFPSGLSNNTIYTILNRNNMNSLSLRECAVGFQLQFNSDIESIVNEFDIQDVRAIRKYL